jgi:predicted homoserine dehydrogenase-like protein
MSTGKLAVTQDIALSVSIDEANVILEALGALPFARVYTLIAKIQTQAAQQLKAAEDKPVVGG